MTINWKGVWLAGLVAALMYDEAISYLLGTLTALVVVVAYIIHQIVGDRNDPQ